MFTLLAGMMSVSATWQRGLERQRPMLLGGKAAIRMPKHNRGELVWSDCAILTERSLGDLRVNPPYYSFLLWFFVVVCPAIVVLRYKK